MCTDARGDASFSRAGKECFHARTPGETLRFLGLGKNDFMHGPPGRHVGRRRRTPGETTGHISPRATGEGVFESVRKLPLRSTGMG